MLMNVDMIKTEELGFKYLSHYDEGESVTALYNVSIAIPKGQFLAVLGRNGSGKSTFARLMNSLLLPSNGIVYVKGMDTRDERNIWEIRRTAGMVFQNPDNQIVGTIVEEDIAFGPENLGFDPARIRQRVDEAIEIVGLHEYAKHAPHYLSGGQKQRVAIAGILAMKPECIIFDEATSMLDPIGRKEVMGVMKKLNKDDGITVVHITHNMEEAIQADRVIVMDEGSIALDGTPGEVFSKVDLIKGLGLDVPQVTELFHELKAQGYKVPGNVLDVDEAVCVLVKMLTEASDVHKG
jgi:energy-coupling factor transport system ATP-binding protein